MESIKIGNRKGHEIAREHILRQIREGALAPGEKLPSVAHLAESFGVGRSTIREAISALKAMGWLDVRHGGGTYVRAVLPSEPRSAADSLFQDADSLIELLEVRKVLETGAASLAAGKRTEANLAKLGEILGRMEKSLAASDTTEGERADVAFHIAIAEASGNSLLIQLMESLSVRLGETIRTTRELWFYREQSTAERLYAEHESLYLAIERRDEAEAAALIQTHLTKVETVLKKALEQN